jgi:ABC-type lipoprotein export system ATPase subunit
MSAAPETSTRYALDMRDVSVGSMRDMETIVVENVNWSVASGDWWVISGLQGTGKSDFLMMAAGLMAPASGTYCFLGEEMPIFEDHRLPDRLKLGFVFENGQLFNHLTISENISLPLRYQRDLTKEEY